LFFNGDGTPCYRGRDLDGHIWYDPLACKCDAWEDDRWYGDNDDDTLKRRRKAKLT